MQAENSIIRGYAPKRFEQICNLYKCIRQIDHPAYQKQIGAYFACLLYNALAECAKWEKHTTKEAKKIMRSMIEHDISLHAIQNADVSKWAWKDKLKVFLMKHKLIDILYFIFTKRI